MKEVLDNILGQIEKAQRDNRKLLLVIDGKCGSGKTTFAARLGEYYKCNVFHMDDFYLPIAMQTEEVMRMPGGNINFDRFIENVMLPLNSECFIDYRPFLCIGQTYAASVRMETAKINIIEGTYSCHPRLRGFYEQMKNGSLCTEGTDAIDKKQCQEAWNIITLFFDIDDANQIERLKKRVGEQRFKLFEDKWIPRERQYFDAYGIRKYCDYSIFGMDESVIKY